MIEIELLLTQRPRAFKKTVFQDGTKVYTYLPHDRYFGWAIVKKKGKKAVVPAIGKLKYPFEMGFGDEEVYIYLQLSHEARQADGGYALIKYDGFWTMAWEFEGGIVFRTRQKPFIGDKSATARLLKKLDLAERVKKYVKDGYWPMFEVWGPGLEKYGVLNGGTRVHDLWEELQIPRRAPITEAEKKHSVLATVIGAFDTTTMKWLEYGEVKKLFDDFYVAETLAELGMKNEHIPMHPKNIIKIIDDLEKYNLERGMKKTNYSIKDGKIIVKVPPFDNPRAVLEGAVIYDHNRHVYRGFKLKPYTVLVIDTYTKNKPPTWRVRQEVVKVISDADELYFAKKPQELVNRVIEYLSEDYKITRDMKKYVQKKALRILAEIILKNHPEYAEKHPRELAKEGWNKSFIGTFITTLRAARD